MEEQGVHDFFQIPLQCGTFQPLPFTVTGTVNLIGEMLGDELFLSNLTAFVHRLLTAGNGFGDIPFVSLDGDMQPTTTAMFAHSAAREVNDVGQFISPGIKQAAQVAHFF